MTAKELSGDDALDFLGHSLERLGVGAWELYLSHTRSLSVEAEEGKVESLSEALLHGVGVRVLRRGAPGFSYSTSFAPSSLEEAAEKAVAAARVATPEASFSFPAPAAQPRAKLGIYDPQIIRIPREKKVSLALSLEEAARRMDPRISAVRNASYSEEIESIRLRSSLGVDFAFQESSLSTSVLVVATQGKHSEMGFDFENARCWNGLDAKAVAKRAAEKACQQLGAKRIKGRSGPVILENNAACEVLEVLSSSFCADQVRKGKSSLAGKRGKKILAKTITLVDDGLLAGGLASAPFDDEGVASQRTVLVQSGRLEGFLYDTAAARREGEKSTGNAVREDGFRSIPGVGPTNFYFRKGRRPLRGLLSDMGEGLLVTELLGVHTADPVTGDFSFGCSGFVVRREKKAGPFNGMAISGNLFDVLGRVEAVGSDLRFSGGFGSPSLLIGKVDVSGE
ncbi:MAG: TldD/PmbA family protein [Bdellovibrionota bacterium]